jgi:citronellol/citronellal dehydrogenase
MNTAMPRPQQPEGKTLVITGASRGIGLAIGKRAARDGANVVLLAKTTEPNPRLPGTLASAAEQIEAAGGQALPVQTDIRDEAAVAAAVQAAVSASAASTSWSTTPARSA